MVAFMPAVRRKWKIENFLSVKICTALAVLPWKYFKYFFMDNKITTQNIKRG